MRQWYRTAARMLLGVAAAGAVVSLYLGSATPGAGFSPYLLAGELGAAVFGMITLGRSPQRGRHTKTQGGRHHR